MYHNDRTNNSCRKSPGCFINTVELIVLIQIFDVVCIRESISEEVACRGLKCLSIMHQRFYCVCVFCTCKLLTFCLSSSYIWNRKRLADEVFVDLPHHKCSLFCFLVSCVDGMSFLPQELSGTKEWTCRLFPSQYGIPLVPYFRKVTVRLHDTAPQIAEQCL